MVIWRTPRASARLLCCALVIAASALTGLLAPQSPLLAEPPAGNAGVDGQIYTLGDERPLRFALHEMAWSLGAPGLDARFSPDADEKLLIARFSVQNAGIKAVEVKRLNLDFSLIGRRYEVFDRSSPIMVEGLSAKPAPPMDDRPGSGTDPRQEKPDPVFDRIPAPLMAARPAKDIVLEPGQARTFFVGLLLPGKQLVTGDRPTAGEASARTPNPDYTLRVELGGPDRYQLQYPLAGRVALPPKELLVQSPGGPPMLASTIQARPRTRYAGRALDIVVGDTLHAVAEKLTVPGAPDAEAAETRWRRGQDERVLAVTVELSNRTDRKVRPSAGTVGGCFITSAKGREYKPAGMVGGGRKHLAPGESGTFLVMFNVPRGEELAVLSVSDARGGGRHRQYRFDIGKDIRIETNAVADAGRLLGQISGKVGSAALGLFNPRAKIGSREVIVGGALTPGSVGLFNRGKEDDRIKTTPRGHKPTQPDPAGPQAEPADPAGPDAQSEGDGRFKTPWHGARVGDTLTYKGLGKTSTVWKVTAVGDDTVTVHQSIIFKGRTQPGGTRTHKRFTTVAPGQERTPSNMTVKRLADETIEVAGMKLTCKVREVTVSYNGKDVRNRTWTCDKVPGGIVKTTSNASGEMRVTMELVDLARGG